MGCGQLIARAPAGEGQVSEEPPGSSSVKSHLPIQSSRGWKKSRGRDGHWSIQRRGVAEWVWGARGKAVSSCLKALRQGQPAGGQGCSPRLGLAGVTDPSGEEVPQAQLTNETETAHTPTMALAPSPSQCEPCWASPCGQAGESRHPSFSRLLGKGPGLAIVGNE